MITFGMVNFEEKIKNRRGGDSIRNNTEFRYFCDGVKSPSQNRHKRSLFVAILS